MHTVSQAIRSLGHFKMRYHRESSVSMDSSEGRLLAALLLAAGHRQKSFDSSAVTRFLRQYQRRHPGQSISLAEAEERQWLRYVLGRATIPRAVSSFSRGAQDHPRPEHEDLITFLQALELEVGRYDALIIPVKKAQAVARKLFAAGGAEVLQQLRTRGLLQTDEDGPDQLELRDITTDLSGPLAARLWQHLCANPNLDEQTRLRAWAWKAERLQNSLDAPKHMSPELTARLVAAAATALLAEPDVQGWEFERARFLGDNRLNGSLLYSEALPSGWKTLPAGRPLGEQLLWASRQSYELNGDDVREPLQSLTYLVVAHDAWNPESGVYPNILRLLPGLGTRPYLLLSAERGFHYRGVDRLPWLSTGRAGCGDVGVLWYLQAENRRNLDVAAPLVAGYELMTRAVRQQLFELATTCWVQQALPDYPQWMGTISYYLHLQYVRSLGRGTTDAVLLGHRQREAQWEDALAQVFHAFPEQFEHAALPILDDLHRRDDVAADRYANNHLPFSLPVLRGCLTMLRLWRHLNARPSEAGSFGVKLADRFVREYTAGLGTAAAQSKAERPYLAEEAGVLDQPWEEMLRSATPAQLHQWCRSIHPVDATAYDPERYYDPILRLDLSRLRTHTAIMAQALLNASADEDILPANRAALQAGLLAYLRAYVLAPLPGTLARLTDLNQETASISYAYPLAKLCAQAVGQLDSVTRQGFLNDVAAAVAPELLLFLAHLAQALPEEEQPGIRRLFTPELVKQALADTQSSLPDLRMLLNALAFDEELQVYAQLVLDEADAWLAGASKQDQQEWQQESLRPRLAMAYFTGDAAKMAAAERMAQQQPAYAYRQEAGLAVRFYRALFVLKSAPSTAYQDFDDLARDNPEEVSYALNRFAAHIRWAEEQADEAERDRMLRHALAAWQAYVALHPTAQAERKPLLNTLYVLSKLRDVAGFYAVWPQAAAHHHEPDFVAMRKLIDEGLRSTDVAVEVAALTTVASPGQLATELLAQVRFLPVTDRLRVLRQQPASEQALGHLLALEILGAMQRILQHAQAVAAVFENDFNAALGVVLTARLDHLGVQALPQSQGGASRNRKQEALRDLTFNDGVRGGQLEEFGIMEALWMDSWESENLRQHLDGLHDYDPYQRGFYILVIYFRGKGFEIFLRKLPANLTSLKWQNFTPVGSPEVLDKGSEHLPDDVYYLSRQRLQRLSTSKFTDLYIVAIHMPASR